MKVGDKVWIYIGSFWEKAQVVAKPENMSAKRGRVFVQCGAFSEVYRYNKEFVRRRN